MKQYSVFSLRVGNDYYTLNILIGTINSMVHIMIKKNVNNCGTYLIEMKYS